MEKVKLRNNWWKPYLVVSFNMDWQDISSEEYNLLIACQPMLKHTTQYDFHELLRC
jgi:hypothetical protein